MCSNSALVGLRVLVLDDDIDSAILTQTILELQQARVSIASQVTQALEALILFEPNLIISDIMMPDIDGNFFIQTVRAQGKHIPAIAISAAVLPQDQQAALAAGYDRFLEKPIDPDRLIATILELLPTTPKQ